MGCFTHSKKLCQKIDRKCFSLPKICQGLFFFIFTIFLSSCASIGMYNPNPRIARGVITEISVANGVKISNAQPSSEEHLLVIRGIKVNYNTFTQSLVEALKLEYQRNNVKVSDSNQKELQVSITKIELYPAVATFRAKIFAEVKYGNGSIEKFYNTRATYGSLFTVTFFSKKPLNAAFKDLVVDIINNENIQAYLNE